MRCLGPWDLTCAFMPLLHHHTSVPLYLGMPWRDYRRVASLPQAAWPVALTGLLAGATRIGVRLQRLGVS